MWIELIQEIQIQGTQVIQGYSMRCKGFRRNEFWEADVFPDDLNDSKQNPKGSGSHWIQDDSGDLNDIGDSDSADSWDSRGSVVFEFSQFLQIGCTSRLYTPKAFSFMSLCIRFQ